MKICIAQTKSIKGNLLKNIANHLRCIQTAAKQQCDLIIFPELSLTGYEPTLAKKMTTDANDSMFNPFQVIANQHQISIGLGMPTQNKKGICISMLFFQPNQEVLTYSKQILHEDEYPYFICGDKQVYLKIKNHKIAFGICFETLQKEHLENAIHADATIYIASVAKSQKGIEKAYPYYAKMAKENQMPIAMSNSIGVCDNFTSAGQTAIWNANGKILDKLGSENEGMLIYDFNSK